jgi:hypothetical protein
MDRVTNTQSLDGAPNATFTNTKSPTTQGRGPKGSLVLFVSENVYRVGECVILACHVWVKLLIPFHKCGEQGECII